MPFFGVGNYLLSVKMFGDTLQLPILTSQIALSAIIGFSAHQMVFIRGEWHMRAPLILYSHVVFTTIIFIARLNLHSSNLTEVMRDTSAVLLAYLGGLFGSITIYRLFFHRLRSFPGPVWAKTTKFWHVVKCILTRSQNHIILDNLHKTYGDFVRTGKQEGSAGE